VGLSFFHNVFAREHNTFVDAFRRQAARSPDDDSGLRDPRRPERVIRSRDVGPDELFELARLVVAAEIAKAPDGYLGTVGERLAAVEPWEAGPIIGALDEAASAAGLNRKRGFQPVRAAVTGSTISPPLPESLELLGRERTIERLRRSA